MHVFQPMQADAPLSADARRCTINYFRKTAGPLDASACLD
jgi:hypothetical protein